MATTGPVKPENIPDGDYANYLVTYGYLYHQKEMLEDARRMDGYFKAIMNNKEQFADKVVLDVGAGSGILSLWAAQAGARKVYAVEATYMAEHAKRLFAANGKGQVVEVLQGYVEDIELPEKVDIIISEWMGYFLLRESMGDSVLKARDKFLAPGGALYPSHCTMYMAPMRSGQPHNKNEEYLESMEGWEEFVQKTQQDYGVDFGCFTDGYDKEQREYFLNTTSWIECRPNQLLAAPAVVKQIDMNTDPVEALKAVTSEFEFTLDPTNSTGPVGPAVNGFCGWFDVEFRGSEENPASNPVTLTTEPEREGATHWGQQGFWTHPPIQARSGDKLQVAMNMTRQKENHRLYDVTLNMSHETRDQADNVVSSTARKTTFHIE